MNHEQLDQILANEIPIAWEAGVRIKSISDTHCETTVPLSKMSQNPFGSMFWAVQGMAAEFTTGFMIMDKIRKSGKNISMLVIHQEAKFTKKAIGHITFVCQMGEKIDEAIAKAIETNQGQTLSIISKGFDEANDMVSEFTFVWSFKVKNKK